MRLRLVALAAAALACAPCSAIDTLRGNRALSSVSGPLLSIGYAPLSPAGTADRPACLQPKNTGEPQGQASNWLNLPAANKEAAAVARDVFKTLAAKIDSTLKLFSYGAGIAGKNDGNGITAAETAGDWTVKDVPMWPADGTRCEFLKSQQASLGYKKNLAQLKAVDALLMIKQQLMYAVNPDLDIAKKQTIDDVDTCMGGSTAAAIEAAKAIPGHIETLAKFLETDMVDAAEHSLFRNLDAYWKGTLLLEHSATCPADWKDEFVENRAAGRATLTWEVWATLEPAAKCWKWYKTLFPEMASQMRASFNAAEWTEYANWALALCMRPKQAEQDCKSDAALVAHLKTTLSTVKPEVKAFFAKTASAPPPPKPEAIVKAAAGVAAVARPGKWPAEGEEKVLSLYAALKPALDQMINTAAPEKGYQVNYVKWRALVQKAADDWATKDAAAAKDWSAKKTAGKASGITELPHWAKNDPRERRRLALEEGRRVVNAVFWSPKDREAVRGEQAKAAQEWLKKKSDARAKAVAAAPKPPGYIDCQWKPNAGMDVKKRNALWIEYLEAAATSFVFTDQPVASCQPSDKQLKDSCNALGEPKTPGFFFF